MNNDIVRPISNNLGMPTLIELESIDENVELCLKLGLSFIELNMNLPAYCPEELDPDKLRKITQHTGIGFSIHLPEEVDVASFQPAIRTGHKRCCLEAIQWASVADIKLINMHMNAGVHFTLPDKKVFIYDRFYDRFSALLMDSMTEIINLGQQHNITVCLENVGNFSQQFIDQVIQKLAGIAGFSLTWDVGHDAASGFSDSPVIQRHIDKISHMHLHDCDGTKNHLTLYTGDLDIDMMLRFASEKDISVVIEVKTVDALTQSVNEIKLRHRS